jgi:hypothetical protein
MNLKVKELTRTILGLDSEGSLESLYGNYSACLRHLVRYLSQKDDSDRKALLAVLRIDRGIPLRVAQRPLAEAFLLTPRDTEVPGAREIPKQVVWRQTIYNLGENQMKIRLLSALAGLAIGFATPAFAQDQNTVDPEVCQ